MTDRPAVLERALVAAAMVMIGIGQPAAQEGASTAERARRAFTPGQPAPGGPANQEQADAEAAARAVAERLGVELIGTSILEATGRQLIAARVMEPASDSNVAFLVQIVVIDPESGEVLGVFPGTEDEIGALPELADQAPGPGDGAPSGGAE